MRDLKDVTPRELLVMHAAISEELRRRGVTRSSNNPVGDLAEHLFRRALGWKRAIIFLEQNGGKHIKVLRREIAERPELPRVVV
jgi:hypothetical protein